MRRIIFLVLLAMVLWGCSQDDEQADAENNAGNDSDVEETEADTDDASDDQNDSGEEDPEEEAYLDMEPKGTIEEDDFDKVFSDPLAYEGYETSFDGQVFVDPERDSDGVYLQVFADPESHEKNIIVAVDDAGFAVDTDDYVHVKGVIVDEFEGANPLGGEVHAPVVLADDIEVVDYAEAVSPALEIIEVDETIDQHGYEIYVDKVEIAANMTRVHAKVTNNTNDSISFHSFNSRLVIDNEQLEEDMGFYEADFPEIQSDILPDVETEGIITFPPIDEETDNMTFHAEGSSDNYDLDFEPFVFEIEK